MLKKQCILLFIKMQRSPHFALKLIAKIMRIFTMVYFVVLALGIGFITAKLLKKNYPESDPLLLLQPWLIQAMLVLVLIQLIVQKLPFAEFQPWLVLPMVKRRLIISFILRFLASPFMLLFWISIITFLIFSDSPISNSALCYWLFGFLLLSLAMNIVTLMLKFFFYDHPLYLGLCAAVLFAVNYFFPHTNLLNQTSTAFFTGLLNLNSVMLLTITFICMFSASIAYRTLKNRLYIDF